jgi:hypothetical protein
MNMRSTDGKIRSTRCEYARNLQFAIYNLQFAIIPLLLMPLIFASQFIYAADTTVLPVEGRPFSGTIISIDAKGTAVFQTAAEKRQLPLADLVAWGACPDPKRAPILVLADGGLLAADFLASDNNAVSAESEIFGRLKIPWDALAGAVFRLPPDLKQRDALLDRVVRTQERSDRLMLDNGDQPAGLIEKINEDSVRLKTNLGVVNIELGRVTAIVFNPALRRITPDNAARTWLGLSDGSRLPASGVKMDASTLQFDAAGQSFKTLPKNLVFLQSISGRTVYLSDLKPAEYRFMPFLDLAWPYKLDRCVTGAWLRAGGNSYMKGIGVHSAARLAYVLDEPYKRFQAETAVDDSSDGGGSVRFRVLVDGVDKFNGEIIRGGMKPVPISMDMSGAKKLELIVDYADRADVLDRADWLNARLIK